MKLLRPLALFALAMGLVVLIGSESVEAAQQDGKKEKLKQKQRKLVQPAEPEKRTEPPVPPKPLAPLGPVGPKDPMEVAKMIDEAIGKKLAEAKVKPSPLASDEEFLRRVFLDLAGVIPTSEKARAFLESKDADKRAKLIDELLASPNFGRHLSDMWQARLLPRGSDNRFILREPFIKWLEAEFNKNTPWNELVANLVSASGTVEENPAVTWFLANRSVDKLTDATAQNFLGVQLQCAQCHNHPFTDWKQSEYWGMAEFYSKVKADRPQNANKGGDNTKIGVNEGNNRSRQKDFFPEAAKTVPAKFLGGVEPKLGNGEAYRPVLAKWMTDEKNPFFSKAIVNRTWAQLFGIGFVNPIDDMHEGNLASHPELFEALARNFNGHGFDLKNLYRAICNSQTYQRSSKPLDGNQTDEHLFSHMAVKVLSPEQLYDSLAAITGGDKARPMPKGENPKRGPVGPRDQFVQFFLAGAETSKATEYEVGIPQALRLMNSRVINNPNLIKQLAGPNDKPEVMFERIYLAALSRRPTADEVKRLNEYLSKASSKPEAYADILWVVMNSSEFTMIK